MAAVDRLKKFAFYLTEDGVDGTASKELRIPAGKALQVRQVTARLYSMQGLPSTSFDVAFELHQRLISGIDPANFTAAAIKMFRLDQWVGGGATVSQFLLDTEMVWNPPVGYIVGGSYLVADLYSSSTFIQCQGEVIVYGNLIDKSAADELLFSLALKT